jgi:hypothetical protein
VAPNRFVVEFAPYLPIAEACLPSQQVARRQDRRGYRSGAHRDLYENGQAKAPNTALFSQNLTVPVAATGRRIGQSAAG